MIEPPEGSPVADAPTPEPPKVPWRAREGILIWFVAWISAGAIGLAFGNFEPEGFTCDADCVIAGLWGNEVVLLALTMLWVKLRHRAGARELGFRPVTTDDVTAGLRTAVLGLLAAYGVLILVVSIVEALSSGPVEVPRQVEFESTPDTLIIALLGIVVVGIAPLAEETFFRGFVFQGLRRWARPGAAIVLSAVIFGAAHLIPLFILTTGVLGLLLGRLVEQRGTIVPAIVAHMAFNAVGFILLVATQL